MRGPFRIVVPGWFGDPRVRQELYERFRVLEREMAGRKAFAGPVMIAAFDAERAGDFAVGYRRKAS